MKDGLSWNAAGELEHHINGELRATVQAEHVNDYAVAVGLSVPEKEIVRRFRD